jgi:hypothetical protein
VFRDPKMFCSVSCYTCSNRWRIVAAMSSLLSCLSRDQVAGNKWRLPLTLLSNTDVLWIVWGLTAAAVCLSAHSWQLLPPFPAASSAFSQLMPVAFAQTTTAAYAAVRCGNEWLEQQLREEVKEQRRLQQHKVKCCMQSVHYCHREPMHEVRRGLGPHAASGKGRFGQRE